MADYNNTIDPGRMIQYEYLNLFVDSILIDFYDTEDQQIKVLSCRSRMKSINIKTKFDAAEFLP